MNNQHAGQVVVVTGASGGIGRATAVAFGAPGAKVALLARGEAGLAGAAGDVERRAAALPLPVDVADPDQVEAAADRVEDELGPIDVWVNVAFTSVFSPFTEITPAEYKRVTEVSYLGYVYGTMAALADEAARRRHDRAGRLRAGVPGIPLQTAYCGAKHAIQGFHEALRCELLHEQSSVHVTMVQMPAVNTPQFAWVLSRLPSHAQPVPPIYQPEVAARGVSSRPTIPAAGSTGWAAPPRAPWRQCVAPGLLDRYLGRTGFSSQQDDRPEPGRARPTWEPAEDRRARLHRARQLRRQSKPRSRQLWGRSSTAARGRPGVAETALARSSLLLRRPPDSPPPGPADGLRETEEKPCPPRPARAPAAPGDRIDRIIRNVGLAGSSAACRPSPRRARWSPRLRSTSSTTALASATR